MSIFTQLYQPFNDLLKEDIGLDWNEFSGNTGIYPDTALLLVEVAKMKEVKTILEIGSGVSTIYLGAAAQKYGKTLISLEEGPEYLSQTKDKLQSHGLSNVDLRLTTGLKFKNLPAPDFIFLDSQAETRTSYLSKMETTSWSPSDAHMIIVDDVEASCFTCPIIEWLSKRRRFNMHIVNLIGRKDRSQFLNCKDEKFDIYEWIWNWRPDKKYW